MSATGYLVQLIFFVLFCAWFTLLPGIFILKICKTKNSYLENTVLGFGLGTVIFTLLLYFFGLLKLMFLPYFLLTVLDLYFLRKVDFKKSFLIAIKILKNNLGIFAVFIVVVFFSGSLLFTSGLTINGDLIFTEYRDAFWHLGLMKELSRSVPPVHPGFADSMLTNYHYFTHLFGSGFLLPNILNPLDFYFRLLPFFLIFLYASSLYLLGQKFSGNKIGGITSVFFGVTGGSLSYVLPFFLNRPQFNWHESSFWLSQPFSMTINPSFALSSSLLLLSIYAVKKVSDDKNKEFFWPAVILSGALISFKVYAGVLILSGLLVFGICQFIKFQQKIVLLIFICSFVLSLVLFLPTNGKGSFGFLTFLPGWFLKSMVESPDRVYIVDWILRENVYVQHGNWFAIFRYRFLEFTIYLVGNFGVRLLALLGFLKFGLKFIMKSSGHFLLWFVFMVGFLIPMFFVQNGSIANTLQFSYYSLEALTILFVLWLFNTVKKKKWCFTVVLLLGLISIPTSIKTYYDVLISPQSFTVSGAEVASLKYLTDHSQETDIILLPPAEKYFNSLLAGTLSGRRVYYSDRLMSENTHKDFKQREKDLEEFFKSTNFLYNRRFLYKNKISFIYIDTKEIKGFNADNYPLKKIYENKNISIFKVL